MKRKNISKYVKVIIYLLGFCVAFLVTVLVILFAISSYRKLVYKDSSHKVENTAYSYQFYELNPNSNEASVGFLTSYEQINTNEYMNYDNSEGNMIMVSNFRTTQYRGKGSCKCGGSEVLSDVPFLFASRDNTLLEERSINELQRTCEKKLEGGCNTFIDSKVWQYNKTPEEDKDEDKRFFMCEGNCVTDLSKVEDFQEDVRDYLVASFDCSKLWKSGEVSVPKYLNEKFEDDRFFEFIHDEFVFHYLKDWCAENSKIEAYNYTVVDWGGDIHTTTNACYCERFTNPTVKCIETFGKRK